MKRLLIGLVMLAATGCTPRMEVSEEAWTGGPWPLTVDRGELSCERGAAVFFTSPDGRIWPLTGLARTVAQQNRSNGKGSYQLDNRSIHRVDAEMMAALRAAGAESGPPIRVDLGGLIRAAQGLC